MIIDPSKIKTAKEWAGDVLRGVAAPYRIAAAEVIRDLPAAIVDGDKVREIIKAMEESLAVTSGNEYEFGHDGATADWRYCLAELLPAPTPQVEIKLGAWAMHPEHGKVLITATRADSDGWVKVCVEDDAYPVGAGVMYVKGSDLSPLPDTQGDSDSDQEPRVLTTEADYATCRRDTVVRGHAIEMAFEKIGTDSWSTDGTEYTDGDMAGVTRTVLWEPDA